MRIDVGKRIGAVLGRMPLEGTSDGYPMALAATDAELVKLATRRQAHRDFLRYQSDALLFGTTTHRAS
jgi:hypothetical protein